MTTPDNSVADTVTTTVTVDAPALPEQTAEQLADETTTQKQTQPSPKSEDKAGDQAAEPDERAQRANQVRSLDDLLSDMDPDAARVISGAVSKARKEAQGLRDRLRVAEPKAAEHDAAVEAQKTAEQRLQEEAATVREQNSALMQRLVRERLVSVAATREFVTPEDAPAFLGNLTEYLGDDGEPDTQRITAAVDDLLSERPYLRKTAPAPRAPAPNRAQGSSGNGAPSLDAQIADARSKGNHRQVIALENSKFQQLGKS